MTTKVGKDFLPHIFKTRGVPTKHDPANAIASIACPSCQATRSWRIVSTRTLKTTKDIKRHCLCLGCGYMAVFMEREIDGQPIIALGADEKEAELLSKIEDLTDKLEEQAPKLRLLDKLWEVVEPGSRKFTEDEVLAAMLSRAGGSEAGPDDVWAPVRIVLGGVLDDKTPATPEAIANAIDQVLTKAKIDAQRSQEDAKDYHADKTAAVRALESAGAKKDEDGWKFPYYKAGGEVEMMTVSEWVARRQEAAVEIADAAAIRKSLEDQLDAAQKALAKTSKKKSSKKPAAKATA